VKPADNDDERKGKTLRRESGKMTRGRRMARTETLVEPEKERQLGLRANFPPTLRR